MYNLNNKIALVTGASRGIGRAIAITLGKSGACVVGTATTSVNAQKITDYLLENNISGKGFVMDVSDPSAIRSIIQEIQQEFGDPNILVNNAGITRDNLILRMKQDEWDDIITTNLNSVFHVSKACLKAMVKARWGRIISITSVSGCTGNPGQANYAAAKAGMIGFSKSLAIEIATRGITVNTIAPGFIETDMTKNIDPKYQELIMQKIPMGRMGQPEDIATAVCFLASPEAAYITGSTIHVNGGMYMA